LGRVESPVHPFQEAGDLPCAHTYSVEGEDGLGKFQRSKLSVGKDLEMEVPLPHAGHLEVLQGASEGEKIADVVTVGLGGMLLQVDLPARSFCIRFSKSSRTRFLSPSPNAFRSLRGSLPAW